VRRLACGVLLLGVAGCAHTTSGISGRTHELATREVQAPQKNACERYRQSASAFRQCEEFRATVVEYLRHLNTGDTVCLENGLGDEVGPACKARGAVVDADAHGFMIEVRDPTLDSKWHADAGQRIYFENGALVEIYLRERGYE